MSIIKTSISNTVTNRRMVASFCDGRLGLDKYELLVDAEKVGSKLIIYVNNSEDAFVEILKGFAEDLEASYKKYTIY